MLCSGCSALHGVNPHLAKYVEDSVLINDHTSTHKYLIASFDL